MLLTGGYEDSSEAAVKNMEHNLRTTNNISSNCWVVLRGNFKGIIMEALNKMKDLVSSSKEKRKVDRSELLKIVKERNDNVVNTNGILDFNDLDVSDISDFSFCFNYTNAVEIHVEEWNTRNAEYMRYMFANNSKLIKLDLNNFDTSKVINTEGMFYRCSNLEELHIENWNIENVKYMHIMFAYCMKLHSIDLANWSAEHVESIYGIFKGCITLQSLNMKNCILTDNCITDEMFLGCKDLVELNIAKLNQGMIEKFLEEYNIRDNMNTMFNYEKLERFKEELERTCEDHIINGDKGQIYKVYIDESYNEPILNVYIKTNIPEETLIEEEVEGIFLKIYDEYINSSYRSLDPIIKQCYYYGRGKGNMYDQDIKISDDWSIEVFIDKLYDMDE